METQMRGTLTEQKCFMKCLEYGFTVAKPLFNNARYDFILDTGNRLLRVQVKSSRWMDEGHAKFAFNGYSQHSTGKGNKRMKYTNKEIDYFMTERDGVFYLYPATEKGFAEKTLRILPCVSGARNDVEYASNYTFEKISAAL